MSATNRSALANLSNHRDPATSSGSKGASPTGTHPSASSLPPILGITPRGQFACEAKCFCAVGDVVWTSERNGAIAVRNGRSGDVENYVETKGERILAHCMASFDGEVWVGNSDGRVFVFDGATCQQIVILTNPECQAAAPVVNLAFDGVHVFAAQSACRVGQWTAKHKSFVRSLLRPAPVTCVAAHNSVLYAGDADGTLTAWDIASGSLIASNRATDVGSEVSALLFEPSTATMWLGRADGSVDIFSLQPNLVRIEKLRVSTGKTGGKITSLLHVGGKVWVTGYDRAVHVYHAQTRSPLGTVPHTATSFVFSIGKIYSLETARIWSLSNCGKMSIFDGEGFFSKLTGHADSSEEVSACHAQIQKMKMEIARLESQVVSEKDRVTQRDIELALLREEKQEGLVRIHRLEHNMDERQAAIAAQSNERQKMLDDIMAATKKNNDQTVQINVLEKEKMQLRGDVARVSEELARARSQFADKSSQFVALEQERTALVNEKARLAAQVQQKERDFAASQEELRRARDQAASRGADLNKKETDMLSAADRLTLYQKERDAAVDSAKRADDAKKRLEDTILLKEAEVKELTNQLAQLKLKVTNSDRELETIQRQRDEEVRNRQRIHDTSVLRNHEYDVLSQEKTALQQQLEFEKSQTHSARDSETKMRLQNEDLRRQLETEKGNVKMLQDQYTIFQFVVNSRGELVNQLWTLYNKSVASLRSLQELEQNIKVTDPTTMDRLTLKREWKSVVVDRVRNSCAAVSAFHQLSEYVVANYFSDYEKMHLGISTSKFQPDPQRPTIVGDQLLTKLRDVTLLKQYHTPSSSKVPQPLPPPYDANLGPHHLSGASYSLSNLTQQGVDATLTAAPARM